MSEARDCACTHCLCPIGTRAMGRICTRCEKGDHPGIERARPMRRIPRHSRMYGSACDTCGAPVGRKCYIVVPATSDGEEGPKW